jgi:hypothetical protein
MRHSIAHSRLSHRLSASKHATRHVTSAQADHHDGALRLCVGVLLVLGSHISGASLRGNGHNSHDTVGMPFRFPAIAARDSHGDTGKQTQSDRCTFQAGVGVQSAWGAGLCDAGLDG